jgi:ribonuclease HII
LAIIHYNCLMPPNLKYERDLQRQNISIIAGVDEAGRGPLAGPVVAAAVILPGKFTLKGIDDSKKLTPDKREKLFIKLTSAVDFGIGVVDELTIDKKNILQATFLAMKQAVAQLTNQPEHILFDGNQYNYLMQIPQTLIVRGDSISRSIAAASIIAKVTRDRLMVEYHKLYPQYGFAQHKGYGTAEHCEAIREHGPCPLHRKTFLTTVLNRPMELPLGVYDR